MYTSLLCFFTYQLFPIEDRWSPEHFYFFPYLCPTRPVFMEMGSAISDLYKYYAFVSFYPLCYH